MGKQFSVQIEGRKGNIRTEVDSTTHSLSIIDHLHHEIHEGESFVVGGYEEGVADNGVLELLVRVGSDEVPHFAFSGVAGGDGLSELWEVSSVHAVGSVQTFINRHRGSSIVSSTVAYLVPSVAVVGTRLDLEFHPGGSTGFTTGGGTGDREEFLLVSGLDYLVRVTNLAGTAQTLGVKGRFYLT